MFTRNQSVKGFALLPLLSKDEVKADLSHLFDLALSGRLTVLPMARFPLNRASDAHRLIDARHNTGKVVLLP
jgi:NADPH2:quinone reductase